MTNHFAHLILYETVPAILLLKNIQINIITIKHSKMVPDLIALNLRKSITSHTQSLTIIKMLKFRTDFRIVNRV